jgi:hypothetical protein
MRDNATLRVKDAEDQVTQAEGEAPERVSRVEAENVVVLASAREPKALSGRSPNLRLSLRRNTRPERWLRRISVACLKRRSMPSIGGRCMRGSVGSNLRSSPFCRPRTPSCATPFLGPHE